MKYQDVKTVVTAQVQKHMANGMDQEEAEAKVLRSATTMFYDKKIGFIDLKYMFQILGYDFSDDLSKLMEDFKKSIRMNYGLTDIIRNEMKAGKSKEETNKVAIRLSFEAFQQGKIEEPEELDALLWALGYRLKEDFFALDRKTMKKTIDYEVDD